MLKSSKKIHPHRDLKEVPIHDSKDRNKKLSRIYEKESHKELLYNWDDDEDNTGDSKTV